VIYLDHHAATPLVPAAREAMAAASEEGWANPSSVHAAGRRARAHLEEARRSIATAVGAEPPDVVLTGGGTEACNLGLLGLAAGARRIVTTSIEHPAFAAAVDRLAAGGADVVRLPVPDGVAPDEDSVARAVEGGGALLAVAWVNHETGTLLPVARWAAAARAAGARVVVDGTQAAGKVAIDVAALGADAFALASHKLGGPAGAGALWVRRGIDLDALLAGGAQERGRRPGTPDVLAHVGFGAACRELPARLGAMPDVGRRRDRLERALLDRGASVNGAGGARVATVTGVSVPGWRGEVLVAALDLEGICASSGAACSSGLSEPSPVVRAMYPEAPWRAGAALRLSLGPEITDRDVEQSIDALDRVLRRAPADFM
jgi:cysteine desulfurase